MRARAEARLPCGDAGRAAAVVAALDPENDGFLRARVEGADVVLEAEADHPATLRRTLDDALACAAAALGAARAADETDA